MFGEDGRCICGEQAELCTATAVVQRGRKSTAYTRRFWECRRHEVKDGERTYFPMAWDDEVLVRENEYAVQRAWREAFGEDLPLTEAEAKQVRQQRLAERRRRNDERRRRLAAARAREQASE